MSFVRNTKAKIKASFYVEPALSETVSVEVRGLGPAGQGGNIDVPVTSFTVLGATLDMPQAVETTNKFLDEVDCYSPFEIQWQVSFNGGVTWLNAGTSRNELYVTLGDPLTTVFHTLVHLGCKNADGSNDSDDTADDIYAEFTDQNVTRVSDNERMKYWIDENNDGSPDMGATDTSGILSSPSGNGNCQAWSALYRDCLKIQGLMAQQIRVFSKVSTEWIMVKNWSFEKHIRTGPDGLRDTVLSGDDDWIIAKGDGAPNVVCINAGVNLVSIPTGDDVASGNNIITGTDGICSSSANGNDTQLVSVGCGYAHSVAIRSGLDGILNSVALGDDVIVGQEIHTGNDGICNSTASGDDVQLIIVDNGLPNVICVLGGINLVSVKGGDDSVNGTTITTGMNGKRETTCSGNDIPVPEIPFGQGLPDQPCIGPGANGVLNSLKHPNDTEQDGYYSESIYKYRRGFDAINLAGIPAQGNESPWSYFSNHYITRYNNQYYDPSYGTPKVGGTDKDKVYEDSNVDGFLDTISGGQCKENDTSIGSGSELNYEVVN